MKRTLKEGDQLQIGKNTVVRILEICSNHRVKLDVDSAEHVIIKSAGVLQCERDAALETTK